MATNKPNEERRKAAENFERKQRDDNDAMELQKGGNRPDAGRGPEEKRFAPQDGEQAERSTSADRGTESWERKDEPGSKR